MMDLPKELGTLIQRGKLQDIKIFSVQERVYRCNQNRFLVLQQICQLNGFTLGPGLWSAIRNKSCGQACLGAVPSCSAQNFSRGLAPGPSASADRYSLSLGEWSVCSSECSGGLQYRTATCRSNVTDIPVDSSFCEPSLQDIQVSDLV